MQLRTPRRFRSPLNLGSGHKNALLADHRSFGLSIGGRSQAIQRLLQNWCTFSQYGNSHTKVLTPAETQTEASRLVVTVTVTHQDQNQMEITRFHRFLTPFGGSHANSRSSFTAELLLTDAMLDNRP
jgi:hypothetical protein